MTLLDEIRALIAAEGPITVERYMGLCLARYYGSRDPLGLAGDFTTAPEINQMFGELIGLWAAAVWQGMGEPSPIHLVELGPGRGTLMVDALRATARIPGFRAALQVHLVETSPTLRDRQRQVLAGTGVFPTWHDTLDDAPEGPLLVVANEFFDALPIRQFEATERGWCERLVALDGTALRLAPSEEPDPTIDLPPRPGALTEQPDIGAGLMGTLAGRLARHGGAALVIDYGYWGPAFGDTLQALKAHAFADPLADPGEADLTAHVDFHRLARAARDAGALVHGPSSQGDFLRALGIEVRASALKARATPTQAEAVEAGLRRLTDPEGMGELFQVLGLSHPHLDTLPGLRFNPLAEET